MDSWTHDVLLLEDPPRPGHVWSEVSLDDNDDPSDTTNPTSVSLNNKLSCDGS